MFQSLKKKWKVGNLQMLLIICTFAIGGSLCGYVSRKLLLAMGMQKGALYIIIYLLLVTLLWPLAVLVVSVPLGQWKFFSNYLHRVWKRITK